WRIRAPASSAATPTIHSTSLAASVGDSNACEIWGQASRKNRSLWNTAAIVAGTARAVYSVSGPSQTRRGDVVTGFACSAPVVGGPSQARRGDVVTGFACSAPVVGGPSQARRGSVPHGIFSGSWRP